MRIYGATSSSYIKAAFTISTNTDVIRTCGWYLHRKTRSQILAGSRQFRIFAIRPRSHFSAGLCDGVSLDSRTHFLRYAAADAKAGELTFTSGHPWETFRLQTAEHLEFWRDRIMPLYFFQESELRGMLTAFSMRGAEQARIARDKLLEI